jgi:MSHA biogenesis protein MshI
MSFLTKITQLFKKSHSTHRVGIALQHQRLAVSSIPQVHVAQNDEHNSAKVLFEKVEVIANDYASAIKSLHARSPIDGSAFLVLGEAQSQIVQVDKPNLPDNEINAALKWLVKDLVTIAPDNMILDYYDVPLLTGRQEKVNVVCAPANELKKLVEVTEQNGLKISHITTQEFAFANLLPAQNDAILLVCQQPNEEIVLIIIKHQQLFFHRRLRGFANIATKSAEELSYSVIDEISLEIQRSSDYFERQLKQAPIKAIKVLLPIELENMVVEKLADNSLVPVSLLEIPRPFHQQREFATAIGVSLQSTAFDVESSEELVNAS